MGAVAGASSLNGCTGTMTAPQHLPDAAAAWTRLWRSGVAHSCSSAMTGNYDGAFLAFWREHFERLAEGSVVVDVGTGNGAIPLLALAHADKRGIQLQIHGVDLADIDPVRDVRDGHALFHGVRFHPRTSMSALPFENGSVDLVCAHFAYEYAPRQEAAREILRVLGSQGRAALVVHSTDSVIARVSRVQQEACRWLLRDSPLLHSTRRLLHAMAGATTPATRASLARNPVAEAARLAFNHAAEAMLSKIEQAPDAEILQRAAQHVSRLLARPVRDQAEAERRFDELKSWLEVEHERLALMQSAAMDSAAVAQSVELLGTTGLPVRVGELVYGSDICMGWTLVAGHE